MSDLTPERLDLIRSSCRRSVATSDKYPLITMDAADVLALLAAVDERDALATAVERVRALHVEQYAGCCNACDSLWPCDTIRALDESEADKCPTYCGDCGESLADMPCDHCGGSGCGPGTASGAYEECGWCAGAGVLATHHRARRKRDRQCAERDALAAKLDADGLPVVTTVGDLTARHIGRRVRVNGTVRNIISVAHTRDGSTVLHLQPGSRSDVCLETASVTPCEVLP